MKRVGFRWLARGSCRHPQCMTLAGGSLCPVDFPAMVGLIDHPERGLFLFDTGYDPAFVEATTPFPERLYRWATPVHIDTRLSWQTWLQDQAIDPARIMGTIVSHFHGDHVAGLHNLAHLPVYCSAHGLAALRQSGRFRRVRQGLLGQLVPPTVDANAHHFESLTPCTLPAAFRPFHEGADLFGDGSVVAVPLPGHCAGHWGLAFHSADGRPILLAADAAWSYTSVIEQRPPPRLTTALLGNTRHYRTTLAQLGEAARANDTLLILPSHCAASAVRVCAADAG